ncbi:hypothetical protein LE181_02350 [Streptomyces sp. SCA3-4]|uniref:hypothetical protein n=1 Tax=Streptomyces sichuanensis TaxID=2871810 RepID=UPI001CE25BC0|nr:hypothetical protein [Streptomyces sichuanensis]MCA6091015.1 hypothetical protein [Streptomyces sichuanensis]
MKDTSAARTLGEAHEALAAAPHFGQAFGELRRTVAALRPYARRAPVRELRQGPDRAARLAGQEA